MIQLAFERISNKEGVFIGTSELNPDSLEWNPTKGVWLQKDNAGVELKEEQIIFITIEDGAVLNHEHPAIQSIKQILKNSHIS